MAIGTVLGAFLGLGLISVSRAVRAAAWALTQFFRNALPATHTAQDEAKLLRQFAALKTEFGLTDRYRIEGWRAGRE